VFRPLYSVYCLCVNMHYCHRVSTQFQLNDDDGDKNNNSACVGKNNTKSVKLVIILEEK
jgi:hypothetical protein